MDLLRLVLAHQSLKKLTKFPSLLRSYNFRKVRSIVVNTRSTDIINQEKYLDSCTRQGELFRGSGRHAIPDELCYRAIFLNDWEMYKELFSSSWDMTCLYRYSMLAGIPEIQLVTLSETSFHNRNLGYDEDFLVSMSWTPEIIEIYKKIEPKDSAILGYLKIPVQVPSSSRTSFNYFKGYALKVLSDELLDSEHEELETVFAATYGFKIEEKCQEWHPLMEQLMACGYVYPIKLAKTSTEMITQSAIRYSRYKTLIKVSAHVFPDQLLVQNFEGVPLRRIEKAVAEMGKYPQLAYLVSQYRIILGERLVTNDEFLKSMMYAVGIPCGSPQLLNVVLQFNFVGTFYDSAAVLASSAKTFSGSRDFYLDAFRLGRGK